jgi:spore coat polysaccharide biosynthesis protein SpsF (cytidylyltransferase family)
MNESIAKIPAFVTVRSTSSRLPEKCFLPFGEVSVLEHVIHRAQHYGLEPIVCTTEEQTDDAIVELAIKCNVKYYRGPTANKLLRWSQCCEYFNLSSFHSVDADDLFFCGDEVCRSFALLEEGYDMVEPSPSSSNGGATVGYSLKYDIVDKACQNLNPNTDTEMMWSYINRVPRLQRTILPDPESSVINHRMTLDYPEDYILLEAIRLMVGNLATRKDVHKALNNNPGLAKINAFRSAEWLNNQLSKSL